MRQPRRAHYGSLDSYVIDSGADQVPEALVILCHGFGAPGSDLVGIVAEWEAMLGADADRFRFICPIAPQSLSELGMPQGRAWWMLNMSRLMEAVQAKRFDELHQESPPGLDQARSALAELVNLALEEISGVRPGDSDEIPLALGGFSQGAMLTMDTTLRGDIPVPQFLIQFSGTVICQPQWTVALNRLERSRVYQSHGRLDPILPFSSAERLRDLIQSADVDIEFHAFDGPHTIVPDSIATTAMGLKRLLENPA
jgi:phospholipase/carboxylesterase